MFGAITNFRKVTTGFVMAVSWLPLDRFKKFDISNYSKICGKVHALLNPHNVYIKRNVALAQNLSGFSLELETLQNKFVDDFKKHTFLSLIFF